MFTRSSQGPDETVVCPNRSEQVRACVWFVVRLYVNLNVTESVFTVAPSAGDGGDTKVIAGLFGFPAAEATAVTTPTRTAVSTVANTAVRTRAITFSLPSQTRAQRAPYDTGRSRRTRSLAQPTHCFGS